MNAELLYSSRRENEDTTPLVIDIAVEVHSKVFNRICAIRPDIFLPILRLWDLKLTILAVLLSASAQWCTSWRHQPRACVRTQGINPRGIMCLLDGVVLVVQAPYWEPLQEVAARSFFGGAGS